MFAPSSPVTGGPQTGLTSPTYTFVADTAPSINAKQYAVSAVGGTQTGVTVSSVGSPFTNTFARPAAFKLLGQPNPTTGLIKNVPVNTWKWITRKGVTPAANQPAALMTVITTISIPAGAETYDSVNVKAALSLHFGMGFQQSDEVGDSVTSGVL